MQAVAMAATATPPSSGLNSEGYEQARQKGLNESGGGGEGREAMCLVLDEPMAFVCDDGTQH